MDSTKFDSVYSNKVKAGKRRTYFFDVRKTKGDDYYITLTESTRKFNEEGYERHKIFLYKEDFNRFLAGLSDAIEYVKSDLMPDYDYSEFDHKNELTSNEEGAASQPPQSDDIDASEDDASDSLSW